MKRYLDLRVDQTVPPLVENDGTCLCTMTGYLNLTHTGTYCNSLLLINVELDIIFLYENFFM